MHRMNIMPAIPGMPAIRVMRCMGTMPATARTKVAQKNR
jgi:hypothetical protein